MKKAGRPTKIQTFAMICAAIVLSIGYSNCGLPFRADPEDTILASSRSVCESDLQATFKSSYYPLITSNCATCHNDAGVAPLKIASADQNLAYNAFMQATESLVSANAIDPNHAAGHTGPSLQTAVTAAHSAWQPAYDAYNTCLASGNTGAGTGDSFDLVEQNFPNLYFQDNQTVTAQWDLNSQGTPASNRFPGVFLMDIKVKYGVIDSVNQPIGYTFTNPRVQMFTGEKEVEIEAIVVRVNGAKLAGMEQFLSAHDVARRIDPVIFYNGSVTASLPTLLSSDRISVSFGYMNLRNRTDALVVPTNPTLAISNMYTRLATLSVSITGDSTARMWCLTTVNRAPASTADRCPGYENSAVSTGWSMTRPTTFNLADMGPLPADGVATPLYLWVANSDLKINPGPVSANFVVDTVAPTAPTISASVSDTQAADLVIPDTNEPIAGWCVKESAVLSDIATNYSCTTFVTTKPAFIGLASGGTRYIRATLKDRAGNTVNTNYVSVNNPFGRITYVQLTDASGSRAVFTNRCVSCHGTGQSAESYWKLSTVSDTQAVIDADYADTVAKKNMVKQDAGLTGTAPTSPGHDAVSLTDREKALLNLWFTQTTTPVEN